MYRLLIVLALCGHLANATAIPSDTSSQPATTYGYVTAEDKTTETVDGGWSSYTETLEALSKVKGWFEETYAQIRDKVSGLIYGEAEVASTPLYKDLCTADVPFEYEARSYNDSVWVSVVMVNVSSDDAVLYATPKLEEYFNGRNDQNLIINMTTPLRMTRPRPEDLPGTDDENTVTSYSLYLPREWHENPPKPLDGEVVIQREPAKRYFVKRFSSHISSRNLQELLMLETLLNQRREQFVGDQFFTNVYDPSLNRPDEVMLLVKPSVVEPTCKVTLSDLKLVEQKEPKYVELCKDNENYEARLYFRAIWVSTTVNAVSPQLAELTALPLLDKYFNRHNNYGALIPKTEPVRLTMAWPSSTFNLLGSSQDYTFSYFVPFDPAHAIPQPLDDDVVVLDEPASTIFAMRFAGFSSDPYKIEKLQELRTYLDVEQEDYVTSDPFALEFYDSKSLLGLYHYNEVLVPMDPSVKQPKCVKDSIPPCYHRGKHCPSYRIMETFNGNIEHRHLAGSLYVMKRTQTCIMDDAYSDAYLSLHRYFYGQNSKQEMMTRTTPVILVHKETDNPPVGCDFSYNLLFYLPPDKHLDPPEPIEDGIELARHESKETYVITFTNSTTEEVVAAKEDELRTELDKRGLCYSTNEFFIATYDAPFRQWTHRFEIWIPQAMCTTAAPRDLRSVTQPKCVEDTIPQCYHRGKHCPSYGIMETFNGNIEHRRIAGSLYVMKRTQTCIMDDAYNDAYLSLHRYFYGQNSKQEMMNRTTPVILVHKETDNPPVGCDFSYNLLFYLPPDKHLDPPEPIENGIELTRHECKEMYVIIFTNSTTEEVVAAKENELRTELDKRGLCYSTNEFFIATYDAPWRQWTHRYEIWIPQAMCTTFAPSSVSWP